MGHDDDHDDGRGCERRRCNVSTGPHHVTNGHRLASGGEQRGHEMYVHCCHGIVESVASLLLLVLVLLGALCLAEYTYIYIYIYIYIYTTIVCVTGHGVSVYV